MPTPHLRLEDTGETYELTAEVTTVGRGEGVDIVLDDPSVSRLHAELVRRGTYVYVSDLGLSTNGTRVVGLAFLLAAVLRLTLPARSAGWLVVRTRGLDAAVLLVLGLAVVVLAETIPPA